MIPGAALQPVHSNYISGLIGSIVFGFSVHGVYHNKKHGWLVQAMT